MLDQKKFQIVIGQRNEALNAVAHFAALSELLESENADLRKRNDEGTKELERLKSELELAKAVIVNAPRARKKSKVANINDAKAIKDNS